MHFLKGVAAIIFILFNCILVWIPLTFWILQRTWTRGPALAALKRRMDKIVWLVDCQ